MRDADMSRPHMKRILPSPRLNLRISTAVLVGMLGCVPGGLC